LHYTDMEFDEGISRLCDPLTKVSAHYLIHENGEIYNLIKDKNRAWHAGQSYWQGEVQLNDTSIGIELDNPGKNDFTPAQMQAAIKLCHYLQKQYNIPANNILGHSDIAPHRKIDPGLYFDWNLLQQNNIGMSWKEIHGPIEFFDLRKFNITYLQTSLASIGYDLKVTGVFDQQTSNVIRAFQAHFNPKAILAQGGLEYYRDFDNSYRWDNISDIILRELVTSKSF